MYMYMYKDGTMHVHVYTCTVVYWNFHNAILCFLSILLRSKMKEVTMLCCIVAFFTDPFTLHVYRILTSMMYIYMYPGYIGTVDFSTIVIIRFIEYAKPTSNFFGSSHY